LSVQLPERQTARLKRHGSIAHDTALPPHFGWTAFLPAIVHAQVSHVFVSALQSLSALQAGPVGAVGVGVAPTGVVPPGTG
jgi:hypothetical protein